MADQQNAAREPVFVSPRAGLDGGGVPRGEVLALQHQIDLLGDRFEQLEFTLGQILEAQEAGGAPGDSRPDAPNADAARDGPGDADPSLFETLADLAGRLDRIDARLDTAAAEPERLAARLDGIVGQLDLIASLPDAIVAALPAPPAAEPPDLTAPLAPVADAIDAQTEALAVLRSEWGQTAARIESRIGDVAAAPPPKPDMTEMRTSLSRFLVAMDGMAKQQSDLHDRTCEKLANVDTTLAAVPPVAALSEQIGQGIATTQAVGDGLSQRLDALMQVSRPDGDSDGFAETLAAQARTMADLQEQLADATESLSTRVDALGERVAPASDESDQRKTLSRFLVALEGFSKQQAKLHQQTCSRMSNLEKTLSSDGLDRLADRIDAGFAGIEAREPATDPRLDSLNGLDGRLEAMRVEITERMDAAFSADQQGSADALSDILAAQATAIDGLRDALADMMPQLQRQVTALADKPAPALTEHRQSLSRFLVAMEGFTKRQSTLHSQTCARLASFETRLADVPLADLSDRIEAAMASGEHRLAEAIDPMFGRLLSDLQAAIEGQLTDLSTQPPKALADRPCDARNDGPNLQADPASDGALPEWPAQTTQSVSRTDAVLAAVNALQEALATPDAATQIRSAEHALRCALAEMLANAYRGATTSSDPEKHSGT